MSANKSGYWKKNETVSSLVEYCFFKRLIYKVYFSQFFLTSKKPFFCELISNIDHFSVTKVLGNIRY